jgi:hypothetical protein
VPKPKQGKKTVREATVATLDGASSFRSFQGEVKKSPAKAQKRPSRRVQPDKGELSPR